MMTFRDVEGTLEMFSGDGGQSVLRWMEEFDETALIWKKWLRALVKEGSAYFAVHVFQRFHLIVVPVFGGDLFLLL